MVRGGQSGQGLGVVRVVWVVRGPLVRAVWVVMVDSVVIVSAF